MIDGVLILIGTLLVSWILFLFNQDLAENAPIAYFSIYYFSSVSIIKRLSVKQYMLTIKKVLLSLLFLLIITIILPFPEDFKIYLPLFAGIIALLFIGIFLNFFLNKILSESNLK